MDTKYYLIRYDFYSSMGGCTNDIDIVDISYSKDELFKYVEEYIDDHSNEIEEINGFEYGEFEFDLESYQWEITRRVDGMTINDNTIFKIIER